MSAKFKSRLRKREPLFGTIVSMPEPAAAEILAGLGFDWLFVDGEHGALEAGEMSAILQTVGNRIPCIARVPAAEETWIKKFLDLGAAGIIAPQVNTPEQAAQVVSWARYAPEGTRGVGLRKGSERGQKGVSPGKERGQSRKVGIVKRLEKGVSPEWRLVKGLLR